MWSGIENIMENKDSMTETKREIPVLYLVVPCYNEEEVVEKSAAVMGEKEARLEQEGKIAPGSKVMFVNDGSMEVTLRLLH